MAMADTISSETVRRMIIPVIAAMHKDPVPNVRMNVAKAIASIMPQISHNKETMVNLQFINLNLM
jgi:hypothetical protein